MSRFSFCCSKDDTDAHDPIPSVSSSGPNIPRPMTRFFERGEALKITDARFFPDQDGTHELEIKFKNIGEGADSKMAVVIDGKTVKKVRLHENFHGNADFIVNGRKVDFAWDITRYSAKLYFSYEGSQRVVIFGVPS